MGTTGAGHIEDATSLSERFVGGWRERRWTEPGTRVVVACSGGLDSLVLLHLLRFESADLELRVEVAHFDHRMRPDSSKDAEWLGGLCGAWDLPLHVGVAQERPASEAVARRLRYAFLEGFVRRGTARWVVTAHHEDDQVETVLFRILRGTGVQGLRGIPVSRPPGVLRPLLPFTRAEIEAYAGSHFLRPRVDPTNASLLFARNRVRHQLLPLLEDIHPGARSGILRLARNAARTWEALQALVTPELDRAVLERDDRAVVLDREVLAAYPESLRSEILRAAAHSVDIRLSEAGTALAVQFITTGSSGAWVELGGGARLGRDFDRLRLTGEREEVASGAAVGGGTEQAVGARALEIVSPESGEGTIELAGRAYAVRWGLGSRESRSAKASEAEGWRYVELSPGELSFPLQVRGWQPGDRTRTSGGRRRKLKKIFREMQVPKEERRRVPVLVDSEGLVVWMAHPSGGPTVGESGGSAWTFAVRSLGRVEA